MEWISDIWNSVEAVEASVEAVDASSTLNIGASHIFSPFGRSRETKPSFNLVSDSNASLSVSQSAEVLALKHESRILRL